MTSIPIVLYRCAVPFPSCCAVVKVTCFSPLNIQKVRSISSLGDLMCFRWIKTMDVAAGTNDRYHINLGGVVNWNTVQAFPWGLSMSKVFANNNKNPKNN